MFFAFSSISISIVDITAPRFTVFVIEVKLPSKITMGAVGACSYTKDTVFITFLIEFFLFNFRLLLLIFVIKLINLIKEVLIAHLSYKRLAQPMEK